MARSRVGRAQGFTLLELVLTVAILAILTTLVVASMAQYYERANNARAIAEIRLLETHIRKFLSNEDRLPETLADIDMDGLRDPWGNAYEYLNIVTAAGTDLGKIRRDRWLIPLNVDFDLYSFGKDGMSVSPLTAPQSQDDLIRASNGGFVGLGADY